MSETKEKTPQQIQTELAGKLFNELPKMTAEYKELIKHTGGLLAASMVFAYSRGINDVIKFILKQGDNSVQKEESTKSTNTAQS